MKKLLFLFLFNILFITEATAGRGCCSWHGGVCGCSSTGRQICCDGQLSPTCTCTPSYSQHSEKKIPINTTKDSNYCNKWFEIYKSAAILNGSLQNIEKAQFINHFTECVDFWGSIQDKFSYCDSKACFINAITLNFFWEDINTKLENLFIYLEAQNR